MPDILSVHSASRPDVPALIQDDRVLTYAAYNERANRAANAFLALGVSSGHRVAVQAFNSIAGFEVASGLRKIQAIGVPVNFRLRGEELAYVIADSGAAVVCAGPEFVEHLQAARPQIGEKPTFLALARSAPEGWLSFEGLLERAS